MSDSAGRNVTKKNREPGESEPDLKLAKEEKRRNRDTSERLANEMAIIAEIGRVIGSTLNIGEVYEVFASEARKLIPFDRLAVNLHVPDENILKVAYVSGEDIIGRRPGDTFPLKGSVSEVLAKTRTGMYSHPSSVEEMNKHFPNHVATVQAGMRSIMSVPLISRDEVIGSLHFRTKKPNAYTGQDLRLAERIGAQIAGAIANAQLFADLKKSDHSMRESEARYRSLFENMLDGFAYCKMLFEDSLPQDFIYLEVNRAFEEMTGLKNVPGRKVTEVIQGIKESNPELFEIYGRVSLTGKPEKFEVYVESLKLWLAISVYSTEPTYFTAIFENITERKRMEEEIRRMSFRDPLTELYNRRGFTTLAEQQLKAAARNKKPLCLLFLDVDDMKRINDTLGHEAGDKALVETADVLRKAFRESDIIARIGGDEFALLAADIKELNPEVFAARLQQHIDELNAKKSPKHKLAISWGTVLYDPQFPVPLNKLMSSADGLMYAQKKAKSKKRPRSTHS